MSYLPTRMRRSRPDFSITIINIVFLLMMFYLSTGSLIKRDELEADIAFTKNLPLEQLPRPLLLALADGRLFLDGVPVSLSEAAEAAAGTVPEGGFLNMLAEQTLPATALHDLLAAMDAAGLAPRLVTMRRGAAPSAEP